MLLLFVCRTDVLFSPDDRMVVTGISVKKGEGIGQLVFLDRTNLHPLYRLDVAAKTVSVLLSRITYLKPITKFCFY